MSHDFPKRVALTLTLFFCLAPRYYWHLGMALVDLFQLVTLYKQRRPDACSFPTNAPLAMPTTPPRSPLPSAELQQLSLTTPKRDNSAASDVLGSTPNNRGTSACKKQEGDTDRDEKYTCEEYDCYIREDLGGRVFVDFGVFLKTVLHVPADWETEWRQTIEAVKCSKRFKEHYGRYCEKCEEVGVSEVDFYEPLAETVNAVLEVASASKKDPVPGHPQRCVVNDPKKLRGGVINMASLSPDLVVLHRNFPRSGKQIHWANAFYLLEVALLTRTQK